MKDLLLRLQKVASLSEFEDQVLQKFGFALSLCHILTIYFYVDNSLYQIFASSFPICWPFLPNCHLNTVWSSGFTTAFLVLYGIVALSSGFFFLKGRIGLAWCLSAATLALKLVLFLQDYRLMGNYHYMIHLTHALFLFYPAKRQVLPLIVVGFYLAAGTLKFNVEWLSGAAMLSEPLIQGWPLIVLCAYVVILEMILAFGLLAKNKYVFWITLAQFAAFHIYSIGQVGFFYPSVMACLLSIFYLPFLLRVSPFEILPGKLALTFAPVLVFGLAQLAPLMFRGDSALTGQGRIFALSMFDARTECLISEFARYGNATIESQVRFQYIRIRCDPITVIGYARTRCETLKGAKQNFSDLDIHLVSRKQVSGEPMQIRFENFCAKMPTFEIWKDNGFGATKFAASER